MESEENQPSSELARLLPGLLRLRRHTERAVAARVARIRAELARVVVMVLAAT